MLRKPFYVNSKSFMFTTFKIDILTTLQIFFPQELSILSENLSYDNSVMPSIREKHRNESYCISPLVIDTITCLNHFKAFNNADC